MGQGDKSQGRYFATRPTNNLSDTSPFVGPLGEPRRGKDPGLLALRATVPAALEAWAGIGTTNVHCPVGGLELGGLYPQLHWLLAEQSGCQGSAFAEFSLDCWEFGWGLVG